MKLDVQFVAGDCVFLQEISDKQALLLALIKAVPDGSIWSVEGVESPKVLNLLDRFLTEDEWEVPRGTLAPQLEMRKVLLNKESKEVLGKAVQAWNLDRELIHQYIYFEGKVLFFGGDNMEEGYCWVRQEYSPNALLG